MTVTLELGLQQKSNSERRKHSGCRKECAQRKKLRQVGSSGPGLGFVLYVFKIESSESWWKIRPKEGGKGPKPSIERILEGTGSPEGL